MSQFWRQPRRGARGQMPSWRARRLTRFARARMRLTRTAGSYVGGRPQPAFVAISAAERDRARHRSVFPVGDTACQWQWSRTRG